MNFNSLQYFIFLPAVVLGYYVLPYRLRRFWLLAASYVFYMSWNITLVFLILGTTVISYFAGLVMPRMKTVRGRKILLAVTLTVCLGTLFGFKYLNFFMSGLFGIISLFDSSVKYSAIDIILPIGISFYTFQTLSYVIDVYRGKTECEKSFVYYALFVSFFPQLVAGPIERPGNLIPQLKTNHDLTPDDIETGLGFIIAGLVKKVCIADVFAVYVDSVFASPGEGNSLSVYIAAVLFVAQLYCDFSAYSDIASGSARLLGIRLMKNFDNPLACTSIRDGIRRWHISLNSWLKDYVYIPLGGSRKGRARTIVNILIVYTLSGLWHGANMTYVVWGFAVGTAQIAETLLEPFYVKVITKLKINRYGIFMTLLKHVYCFMLTPVTTLIFRAETLSDAFKMLSVLVTKLGAGKDYFGLALSSLNMDYTGLIYVGLASVFLYLLPRIQHRLDEKNSAWFLPGENETAKGKTGMYITMVLFIVTGFMFALSAGESSAFIYFQF